MLSLDSMLFTLGWDNHGELDKEDRQALLDNLLSKDSAQDNGKPKTEA